MGIAGAVFLEEILGKTYNIVNSHGDILQSAVVSEILRLSKNVNRVGCAECLCCGIDATATWRVLDVFQLR